MSTPIENTLPDSRPMYNSIHVVIIHLLSDDDALLRNFIVYTIVEL